ncbi:MAG: flagellar motor switch protein FliN [Candidatus Eremiobacterota bacterium]
MNKPDRVGELLTSWTGAIARSLSAILNQEVQPSPLQIRAVGEPDLAGLCPEDGLGYPLVLTGGLEGEFLLVLASFDASRLVDLLAGGDGNPATDDINDLHRDVLGETLGQFADSLGPLLSALAPRPVGVCLGSLRPGRPGSTGAASYLWHEMGFRVGESLELTMGLLIPEAWAGQLSRPPEAPRTRVQEVHFEPISPARPAESRAQLDLILDVPLQVSVVLGRTSVLVQDLLHLGEGSVLELDKLAGEPVELYVHDRLVAYGEVIVIEERFGVKVLNLAREQRPRARSAMVS